MDIRLSLSPDVPFTLIRIAACVPALMAAACLALPGRLGAQEWLSCAPEGLPRVTVRWEDPAQQDVFIVEGADYQCRAATCPARIVSLRVNGKDLLGPEGIALGFEDEQGTRYAPAPPGVVPRWNWWRRQWVPAGDSRARMNVWSAGPYYWDAHLLDIPLVTEDYLKALATPAEVLQEWGFDNDAEGFEALHNCEVAWSRGGALAVTSDGEDPFLQSPAVSLPGPVTVAFRMKGRSGGGAAFYWIEDGEPGFSGDHVVTFPTSSDGEWHEYRVSLDVKGTMKRLRFDPPGSSGLVEIDRLRIEAAPADPDAPPVRGEVVLHAHPDHLRLEFRCEPNEGRPTPKTVRLIADAAVDAQGSREDRPIGILRADGAAAALLGPSGAAFDAKTKAWTASLDNARRSACWVIRPIAEAASAEEAFVDDFEPLPASAVEVIGGEWLGFDPVSGLYLMQAHPNLGAFGFEAAYMNPTRRVATRVSIRNDARPRRVTVKCFTGIGCLEAAVLADPQGFALPVPVFVAKNFAGELEEPDDSGFGDSYFPLTLNPDETRNFQVLHLMQNWGNHALKQVSSIRFFHIYWHLSTGASETTCFTHDWMRTGTGSIFHIPDFRPLSGPFWAGQPQHDCQQWPGFLQYNGGKVRLMYERTAFESVSPCVARFTAYYHTSDDAATARVSYLEFPQRDEMRTFVRLRYDWQKPVEIEGDARVSFRWANISEFRHPPALLLWTDPSGATKTLPVATDEKPMLLGEPLAKESPFVASHGKGEDYCCVVLVRSFRARLGGREYDQAAASAQFGASSGDWWFTVPTEKLQLEPGDFVEAEIMLMPHGEPTLPAFKPERERTERFGAGVPVVKEVSIGTKVSDFPATVRAEDEVARFSLTGGFDAMPIIVEGFRHWLVPLLWEGNVWQDQQAHGGDGYQVEPDGNRGYRFIFVYPIRKDQTLNLMVTRAEGSNGIARVRDINGRPAIVAPVGGEITLKAPVLFGPGRNVVTAGSPVISFGSQTAPDRPVAVRAVPIGVSVAEGQTEIEIDESATEVKTKGAAASLTFTDLARGRAYAVTVNGQQTQQIATNGTLHVQAPGPESTIAVTRPQ